MSNQNISDRLAVQDVMLNYAAGVDDRNYKQYQNCFADEVEVVGFGDEAIYGKAAWVDFVWAALEKYSASQHMLAPALITLDGDTARARSDVQALHYFKDDEHDTFTLWASYLTDMRRIDGEWKIVHHELVVRGSKLA